MSVFKIAFRSERKYIFHLPFLNSFSFWLSIFPIPDFVELQERNFDPFFFTILLYGVGVMLMYAAGAACYLAVVLSGQAAHKMAIRWVILCNNV